VVVWAGENCYNGGMMYKKRLAQVRAEYEKHDLEAHRQIAMQAQVIGALFLVAKGNRRRVMVPKNLLAKAAQIRVAATVDRGGNLVLTIAPPPVSEPKGAE
jgi:hypothetical protein